MTKPVKYKKLRKFIRDPNMFFYDMFRKKVFKNAPPEVAVRTNATPAVVTPAVDLMEVQRKGVVAYITEHLGAGIGPEDGNDENSLLIWNGYLAGLISFIDGLKEAMTMNVTIYTLGGGFSTTSKSDEKLDVKAVTKNLASRPDFIIEMSNIMGDLFVLHIYTFDLNANGIATVRSNRAWIRKFSVGQLENLFQKKEEASPTPIDAVYTWVDHKDADWQTFWLEAFPEEPFDPDRYTSNDELRYSLRSLNKYAPWLNKIYIVSNCSKPAWLAVEDKIVWVKHEEIFSDSDALPTFNSHAIEACLHNIKDLSERFIYLNDDFVLSQPCLPNDFFDEVGRSLAYFEPYGMVDSLGHALENPDYLIAAKNSRELLKTKFASYEPRNLHRHVPYALRKSILIELEHEFPTAFHATRHAKRRSTSDVNLTSFLYHHFAYAKGMAVKADAPGLIVRPENIKNLITRDSYKYKLLCFNDGNGSADDKNYKADTQKFFDKRFSERAPWETFGAS